MRLLVVTTMRNEGPFLLEWVAWLRLMGVTDLLVYSNDCDDDSDTLLDCLAQAGVLHHIRQGSPPNGRSLQWQALKAAWQHPLRREADWAACLDCDEFPVPFDAPDLTSYLAGTPGVDAHAVPWRLFGHAGHITPPNAPVTQAFQRAAPEALSYPAAGSFVKSFFRLSGPFNGFGVHRPKQKRGAEPLWCGPDGAPLPEAFSRDPGRINLWGHAQGPARLQLNHYSLRAAESFLVKRDRGLPNRKNREVGLSYWVERNFNTVEETRMTPHAPALADAMTALRALPGVAEHEATSRAWHAARVRTLLHSPETAQLLGRLVLAAGSVAPPEAVAQSLVRAYTRAVTQKPDDPSAHD